MEYTGSIGSLLTARLLNFPAAKSKEFISPRFWHKKTSGTIFWDEPTTGLDIVYQEETF